MERILSTELAAHAGEEVVLQGWLHRQRRLANVSFVVLRDRAGLAQIVLEEAAELLPETVLEVRGRVVTEPQVELHDAHLTVLAAPAEQPPLELHRPEPKESLPVRLDLAPLALRHPAVRDRFKVAARAVAAFRETLDAKGFTEIQTPKLVATATEGGANLFRVDYFGGDAFLAQSPQFFKQTMVGVFERVYEVGPVFRAEPHETGRHLSEYVSLDAELGFIRDHRDVMAVLRDVVCAMIEAAGGTPPSDVPVVRFEDVRTREEPDLAPDDERRICAEHGELVFVEGYPTAKRPFYTHPDPDRPEWSRGFDLLYRGLEIVTGGQRLHRYGDYLAALGQRSIDPAPFGTYLDAFKYGMPPHGGFAIGLERFTAQVLGLGNVRETALFPRDRNRLAP
ncbi:MAG TPA: amino acid--tRNA ligase-related protein [Gaiellaceae bacterium]|nr:amino acid--tRNA ligase-related protein [Gaiellaceae bacterium]